MGTQNSSFIAIGRKMEYMSAEAVVGELMWSKEFWSISDGFNFLSDIASRLNNHVSEQTQQLRTRMGQEVLEA